MQCAILDCEFSNCFKVFFGLFAQQLEIRYFFIFSKFLFEKNQGLRINESGM